MAFSANCVLIIFSLLTDVTCVRQYSRRESQELGHVRHENGTIEWGPFPKCKFLNNNINDEINPNVQSYEMRYFGIRKFASFRCFKQKYYSSIKNCKKKMNVSLQLRNGRIYYSSYVKYKNISLQLKRAYPDAGLTSYKAIFMFEGEFSTD